jgi:two-component system nitrogen regulation sensor histidine kinase GlnL
VTFINSAAQTLLGLSERQSIGRNVADLVVPPHEVVELCERTLDTRLTFGLRELCARVGDRELKLDCRASPLENGAGLLLELFDTDRDLSVRREAEFIAQQKLSRRIIRQLAHEVKNPLGGLRGAAQLLERQLPNASQKEYTKVIIDEADRLAALVDSILSPGATPQPTVINLHEITEHVANLVAAEKNDSVELVRDYDPSLPPIEVDRNQMIQAFLNLARNAMQAVGQRGRLIFRTRAFSNFPLGGRQHRLVLSAEIEDSGPGIADELKDTIFYPLITGKPTGTGLGLTIAQDLVSRNGGLIEFTSRPGSTVFRIRLPMSASAGAAKGPSR